jgi:outer membrane biosynthesis protein TonB
MFCTQCGTPFELGQNFCKHCGVRVNQHPDLRTLTETPKREGPQVTTAPIAKAAPVGKVADDTLPYSPSRERQGINMSAIVGGCLALILAGSAVIYFGTDLLRQPAKQKTSDIADVPASPDASSPDARRREEAKNSTEAVNDNLSSPRQAQEAQTPPPVPADSPHPAPEVSSKPPPKPDGIESARKSQSPGAEQDTRVTERPSRPPASAARRDGAGGTYQTTRSTTVFESPSASSQAIANIPGGMRVDVVSAKGQWLEVHSRRGNPSGFIRREDATLVEKTD